MAKGLKCLVLSMFLLVFMSALGLAESLGESDEVEDAAIGFWKLNLEKSDFPNGTSIQTETRTIEDRGCGIRFMTAVRSYATRTVIVQYAARYDQRDYPKMMCGSTREMTISIEAIDAYAIEGTEKREGVVTGTYLREISPDGKTQTQTFWNAEGDYLRTMVFDRHPRCRFKNRNRNQSDHSKRK